ncbi:hypothetical protein SAMN05216480_11118 [Pustulibacterium marinum]|uniref:Probable membrane transporter protein n=1 Tax=Pustulibacterium marinum TaxID=1224947 RepID=A0A1I7HU81_9FLAO|nr:sulfite exporter TauE/SafE family protein [Pustulibacterium marinum]SFU64181.1 hypothetical protein SAMN05216480_11118 [Pustulibacterium marinum]
MWMVVWILLGTLISFWISAVCGGGASLLLIPLLSSVLPGAQIAPALTLGTFTSSASRLYVFRKNICWQIVRYYVPAALPAVWLGVWALKFINPIYLQFFMGFFLLLNLKQFLTSQKKDRPETIRKKSKNRLLIIGVLAGFISGVTGATGLLFNRFYLTYGLSKEEVVATRAANDIILHLIKIGLYASMGLFTIKAFGFGVLIALAAVVSSFTITYILPHISERLFRNIGHIAMGISGVLLLIHTGKTIYTKDRPSISFQRDWDVNPSYEAKFQWREDTFSLEWNPGKVLLIETSISFEEIPDRLQNSVKLMVDDASRIVYEKIHSTTGVYYEIHYTKHKINYKQTLK